MRPVDVQYEIIDDRVFLNRDQLCQWLFDAADETKTYNLHDDADFCVRSIAEILIQFPLHKSRV